MSLPNRPKEPEEVYTDYDESAGWCVFGVNSGFCYAQPSTESRANEKAKELNKVFKNHIAFQLFQLEESERVFAALDGIDNH